MVSYSTFFPKGMRNTWIDDAILAVKCIGTEEHTRNFLRKYLSLALKWSIPFSIQISFFNVTLEFYLMISSSFQRICFMFGLNEGEGEQQDIAS